MRLRVALKCPHLSRMGHHSQGWHHHDFHQLETAYLQLDELATKVKKNRQRLWLWTVTCVQSKVLLVMHLGGHKKRDAHWVIHEVKARLAPGCLPVFTSDGLRFYFYSLTAHFGRWWQPANTRQPRWAVSPRLLYGQLKKVRSGYRLKALSTRMLWGERHQLQTSLRTLGLTGKIQTAFVERLTLTCF